MTRKTGRHIDARVVRRDAIRRVLRLPHTVEQLANRFGVGESQIAQDLLTLRGAGVVMDRSEDPPRYLRKG